MPRPLYSLLLSALLSALAPTLLLIQLGTPATAQIPKSRNSSIGVWPFLVGDIDSSINEIVSRAKSTGLDSIYIHIWRTTGSQKGELRIVDEGNTWNSAWGKKLPRVTLSRLIDKAHAEGIQVIGVVQVFRSAGPFPSDQAHQKHMVEKVLRYLVHNYDVRGRRRYALDGIAFDYIRWFGGNHSPVEIDKFLDAARKEVGAMPLHAFVIAGAYALDGASYDNRFRSYAQTLAYLSKNFGQNWEHMAKRLDVLMPMAYTANGHVYGSNLALMEGYLDAVARYGRTAIRNAKSSCRLVPAIRTWNSSGETTSKGSVEACFRGAMRGGADGTMAFRYFTARSHPTWFQGLANWCQPGPDLPIAGLTGSVNGLSASLDNRTSSSKRYARSALRARWDSSGTGAFESQTSPLGSVQRTLPGPGSRVVSVRVEDPSGASAVTSIELGVLPILTPTSATVSVSLGGNVGLRLNPGLSEKGRLYVLFMTLTGTKPGALFGNGVRLPINIDYLTIVASGLLNQAPFLGWFGTINAFGFAAPSFQIPGGILPKAWIGNTIHIAALDLDPRTLKARYASNASAIRVTR